MLLTSSSSDMRARSLPLSSAVIILAMRLAYLRCLFFSSPSASSPSLTGSAVMLLLPLELSATDGRCSQSLRTSAIAATSGEKRGKLLACYGKGVYLTSSVEESHR